VNPRRRLFYKYVIPIIAIVVGALAASGGIGIYFSYKETRNALVALQREKAASAAMRIEQFVREIEHQIGWTALEQIDEGGDPLQLRRIDYVKLGKQVPAITEASYIDRNGREQVSVSRLKMDVLGTGADLSQDPRFIGAREGKTYFGPVYFRKETEPYMAIAMRAGRKDAGVTAVEVNLKFIWEVVQQIKIGQRGLAFVINREGHLVAHPDISLVLQKTDLSMLPQVKAALAGPGAEGDEQADAEARDRSGRRVLTAHAPIETLGWQVFVEQPISEAFAPLYAPLIRIGILLLLGLVLSILASMALARYMVRPINALREGAQAIGAGNLDHKLDVRTGDELQDLAEQFNTMTTRLRESYEGLERKVDERTAELKDTLQQQTATSDILKVISGTITDTRPVFEAIVQSCLRLFAGSRVTIGLERDGNFEAQARATSLGDEEKLVGNIPVDRASAVGRCILEARAIHIADTEQASQEFPRSQEIAQARGYRSVLCVPLVREGKAIGALTVIRPEPGAFTEKEIALLSTFADQAVIAIANVALFREIQEKSAQLEVANKHKSEFLANMSHELRTPLNAVIGFSEVLNERYFGELTEKQDEYVKDIHSSGKHLLSLINDILDLSKIEAGRMELEVSEFDVPAALGNAITLVKERAQRHNIGLKLDVDKSLGAFRADERKFKQIMLNLLSNAVKFTPEGGKVSVAAKSNGAGLEVSVSDTGVGIATEDQQAVFEEFRQVGRDYTRKAEGTGLGLALTKRFVELHGGEIRLQSAPGQGSTFTFTIPVPA
jgi:signal transduction histidine kinase